MKVPQSNEELQKHLQEQLDFLKSSCDLYDQGKHAEGKRIAAILRILLHDTDKSMSLMSQLDIKNQKFLSTRCQFFDNKDVAIAQNGLTQVFLGEDSQAFYEPLDKAPDKHELEFNDWWTEVVLIDQSGNKFSRKNLVLTIANQDGGAHIDPSLELNYSNLSRKNSLGMLKGKDGQWEAMKTPELSVVRQIGHEVLKTLIKGYEKQPPDKGSGYIIGNAKLVFDENQTVKRKHNIGKRDSCPCGSGKRYKNCCWD